MTKKTILFSIIVVCLAALVYLSLPPPDVDSPPPLPTGSSAPSDMPAGHPPVAGQATPAPDFTLKDITGNSFTLSKFKGKVVMLNFWSANCGPCLMEIPSMVKLYSAMSGKPFEILAVTSDDKSLAETAVAKLGINFPVILDSEGEVAYNYMVTGTPTTFLIDPQGNVTAVLPGAYDWSDQSVVDYVNGLVNQAKPAP